MKKRKILGLIMAFFMGVGIMGSLPMTPIFAADSIETTQTETSDFAAYYERIVGYERTLYEFHDNAHRNRNAALTDAIAENIEELIAGNKELFSLLNEYNENDFYVNNIELFNDLEDEYLSAIDLFDDDPNSQNNPYATNTAVSPLSKSPALRTAAVPMNASLYEDLPAKVIQAEAGGSHTLILLADGTVWASGWNSQGQLGNGSLTDSSTFVQVQGLLDVKTIAAGMNHSMAIKEDGTAWCWGNNSLGQLGDNTRDRKTTPVQVQGISNVKAIAAGTYHSLAITEDGNIFGWGDNYYGQLGIAAYTPVTYTTTPYQIYSLTNVKAITAERLHSLVLKEDGTVFAFGENSSGYLGDGTTIRRSSPVQVPGLSGIEAIAGGDAYSLALKADGKVWAWGSNYSGDLGDGTTTDQLMPVQVPNLSNISTIAGGTSSKFALAADGTLYSWGSNYLGALGNSTTIDRKTPLQVTGLTNVKEISSSRGGAHSLALKEDGALFAWGDNYSGQFGISTVTESPVPLLIIAPPPTPIAAEITGKVSPVVYDDLGYGQEFLDAYATYVELRALDNISVPLFKTKVIPDGTSGSGTFTLNNVPTGDYILFISRPGYLTRGADVHIAEDTTVLQPSSGGDIYELLPGDIFIDFWTDTVDTLVIWSFENLGWYELEERLAYFDVNNDGIVNDLDRDIVDANMNQSSYGYPDSSYLDDLSFDDIEMLWAYFDFPLIDPLAAPQNLRVTNVTQNSISLAWDSVAGAKRYLINNYLSTTATEITINNLTPGTTYQFSVQGNNYFQSFNYSTIITVQTEAAPGTDFSLETVTNEAYTVVLTGQNIASFDGKTFTLRYAPAKLTLTDFAAQTQPLETTAAPVAGTPITILSHDKTAGTITFEIDRDIEAGQAWSGVLTAVEFKAKTTGETVVTFEQ